MWRILSAVHSGVLGVARLHRGSDQRESVAQRAGLVERGFIACADEAAVAFEQRQVIRKRRAQSSPARARDGRAQRVGGSVASSRRQLCDAGPALPRAALQRAASHAVAHGGEVAGPAAPDRRAAPARGR